METKENGKGVYQILTDQIIMLLERGTIPWRQPWSKKELPQNLFSKIPYKGFNMMLLSAFNFERNLFLTFNQIKHLNASIKKGEKSIPVVFWKWPEPKNDQDDSTNIKVENQKAQPILRYYAVFNISQCKNIPENLIPRLATRENDPITNCVQVVSDMPHCPEIRFQDQSAYYNPALDIINMPDIKFFDSSESYYATLFHELAHSTGHEKRLNRQDGMKSISFGSDKYSTEELIAELGACYLEAHTGIAAMNLENNAAYINGWLQRIKENNHIILYASSKAQKAADYILGKNDEGVMSDQHANHKLPEYEGKTAAIQKP